MEKEEVKAQFRVNEGRTKLINKLQTIRTNKAKIKMAMDILTTTGFIDLTMDSEGRFYSNEVDSVIVDYVEGLDSIIKFYNHYEEAILNELEEPVPTVQYKLKVYLQKSKKTVRYYYNSTYLFSAPVELKEMLDVEFTRLMNEEPKLALTEVFEKLEGLKNLLVMFKEEPTVNELESNPLIEVHEVD